MEYSYFWFDFPSVSRDANSMLAVEFYGTASDGALARRELPYF
jgi:hypothetical protein